MNFDSMTESYQDGTYTGLISFQKFNQEPIAMTLPHYEHFECQFQIQSTVLNVIYSMLVQDVAT